jgi:hypothetical protein
MTLFAFVAHHQRERRAHVNQQGSGGSHTAAALGAMGGATMKNFPSSLSPLGAT